MTGTDLFGQVPPAPPAVQAVPLNQSVRWDRIVVLNKPRCGHCTMLRHADGESAVLSASWTRTGRDGSVLDLCHGHVELQKQRDDRAGSMDLDAESYALLREAIIQTMEDPDSWDGDESEANLLIRYVEWLSLKIHDINTILDRDMT